MTGDLTEFFRHDSPVWVGRTVTRPVELSGVRLAPGDRVMAHIGSAHQDEAIFAHGGTLDLSRGRTRNLCFRLGPRYCMGAPLGKLIIEVGFAQVAGPSHRLAL